MTSIGRQAMTQHNEEPYEQGASDSELEEALDELEHAADRLRIPREGALIDGRYRMISSIGAGGFGQVFEVRHRLLDQRFAMKLLHPRISRDEAWVLRFREEARATSLIGHENIVFVTDFGECPEHGYYLIMEYLDGQSLHSVLREEPVMSLTEVVSFALSAGSALSAVHDLGIVHCDLKPSNVMRVERPNRPPLYKILDFGTSTSVMNAVESDDLFGTPRYMSPEQAVGLEVDHRADQFSLGCILYEMLTGKPPWNTRTWMEATAAHRKTPPALPSVLTSSLPSAIDDVLLRALQIRPANRWPGVQEFVEALQTAAGVRPVPAIDPLDVRADETGFRRSLTSPAVSVPSQLAGESLAIFMEGAEGTQMRPTVRVVFRTPSRLQREVRRNLIAGGLFIPSDEMLPAGQQLTVDIRYEPRNRGIQLDAEVVSHMALAGDNAVGYGVAFHRGQERALRRFLDGLDLAGGLSQDDLILRTREPQADDDISAGEAFLLSRLSSPLAFGRIRGMFSGLPFEVEEVVSQLLEKGFLELERGAAAGSSAVSFERAGEQTVSGRVPTVISNFTLSKQREMPEVTLSEEEIEQVLELIAHFRERHNYLAAVEVLEKTVHLSPDVSELHYQLAELYSTFRNDVDAARAAMDRALALEPENPVYLLFRSEL